MKTLEQLFKDSSPWLIGIWRFREKGKPQKWCATYCVDGDYYDISGKSSVRSVLNAVIKSSTTKCKRVLTK